MFFIIITMDQWEEWECIPTWKSNSNVFLFINTHNQLCFDDNTSYNSDCEGDYPSDLKIEFGVNSPEFLSYQQSLVDNHETPLIHGPYTLDELSFFE